MITETLSRYQTGIKDTIIEKPESLLFQDITFFKKQINEPVKMNGAQRKELPLILIAETHDEVRNYIVEKLTDHYNIIEAIDGREAYHKATTQFPDLVISDVMMPEITGFELCGSLKEDERTNHIPIILLTTCTEDADKIPGLEKGADAYLVKPINSKELMIRVRNLIELRKKLRSKFSHKPVVKTCMIPISLRDRTFLQGLMETIEKHLDDEHFSVEQLSYEFAMSASQINRKLKMIINQSSVQFIRSIRMQHALELLKKNSTTIAEIAYQTGFSEPAYFSRIFKSYYGYAPSEIKKTAR